MNSKTLKPAILSISLLTLMASAAVSPALAELRKAFPDVGQTTIKLILTLPSLMVIPFSLLSGWLAVRMNKKTLALIGLVIYACAGVGGGLAQNFRQLLVMRAILGIGLGIIMPLSTTFIMDFFSGEERPKMMGLQAVSNQLGGLALLAVAGWLAFLNWRYAFGVYALAFLSIALVFLWLPEPPKPPTQKKGEAAQKGLPLAVFGLAGLMLMMMTVYYVFATDLALFIESEKTVFSRSQTELLFQSATPLFKDKEELMSHLRQKSVSDVTAQLFKAHQLDLSPHATLREIEPQQKWEIIDGIQTFIVQKESGTLMVYAGLGTSGLAANTFIFGSLSGIAAGILLSTMLKLLKNYIVPSAAVLMGIGYWMLGHASAFWMVIAAAVCIGLACGLMSPPVMLHVPKVVSPEKRALATAVVSSSLLFGQFVSPYFMSLVTRISGQDSFRFRFSFLAVFLCVAAAGGAFGLLMNSRKTPQPATPTTP